MNTQTQQVPVAVVSGWEYWTLDGDVFRVAVGNRGYMLPEGVPANARWECSVARLSRTLEVAK